MKKIFFAILLASSLFVNAFAQTFDRAKLDLFFDRLEQKNKAMGSMVIAKDGTVVYNRSIGYGEIGPNAKKPLTPASRFRIGSITKMFTGVMVYQLVEKKKLKLTDTVDKFFPQIPNAGKVTIGHILAHRSGLHDSLMDPQLRTAPRTVAISKADLLSIIAKGKPDFEPDTKHAYNNSGYVLLGLIIERVTGEEYGNVLAKQITSKIGLKDTYVATGNIDVAKNEAITYIHFGGDWKTLPETHPSNMFSAGAIVSTPYDLAKFIQALFDLKLISQANLDLMKTMRDGNIAGMEPFPFAGKTFYGHTGGGDNYGAWIAYLPEEKLAVAYTTNAKIHPVGEIVSGSVDIYYNKPFVVPTFDAFALSSELLEKYVGVYSGPDAPVKFTISRQGNTLYFQPGQQESVPLEATGESTFKVGPAIVIEFDAAKNQMTIKRGPGVRVVTKEKQ